MDDTVIVDAPTEPAPPAAVPAPSATSAQPAAAVATTDPEEEITADEVALYDRQIRLWGVEAQTRMSKAHILLVTIKGLGNEIAKNLVLAGIGALTVNDPGVVTEEDLGAQFLITEELVGRNRAEAAAPAIQKLNPRVEVRTDISTIEHKDTVFFKQFSIVIVTEADLNTMIAINNACREAGVAFYSGASYGLYGYAFADLIKHEFLIEREKGNVDTKLGPETRTRRIVNTREKKEDTKMMEYVTKEETYSPLSQVVTSSIDKSWRLRRKKGVSELLPALFALWKFQQEHMRLPESSNQEDIKLLMTAILNARDALGLPYDNPNAGFVLSFLDNVESEFSPVAAVVGGMIAQGVINFLGKREQPLQNLLLFDGDKLAAPIYSLHPQED